MAYELRDFSDVAPATTIASDITNVSTTITVASGTGYPSGGAAGDFIIQVESELIRCSSRSGTSLTVSGGVAGRGINGTTAVGHVTGVAVNHVHTAVIDSKEANYAVSKTVGKVTTSQDLLVADAANSFTRLGIGANGTILQAVAGSLAYGALGANTVGASQITDGTVGSAELASGAVIAGKIAVGGVSAANQFATGVVDSTAILDGTILNADINAAAAVALSKLAAQAAGTVVANNTAGSAVPTAVTWATAKTALAIVPGDVTGFDTQVRTSTLNQMTAPTADLSVNSHKVTNVTTPTASTDVATKGYVDKMRTLYQQTLPGAGVWASGNTIATLTVTDPGYNIIVWVSGTVAATATGLAFWEMQVEIDGVKSGGIIIPQASAAVAQTYAVLGRITTHSTGTNCSVVFKVNLFSGSGSFTTVANTGANNLLTAYYTWDGT